MPFLTVNQWRVLLVAGCALLLAAGWRLAYGADGGPVVLDPEPVVEECNEEGPEGRDGRSAEDEAAGDGSAGHGSAGNEADRRQDASADTRALPADGMVDVNRADADQLQQLPGIGPVLAARIIEHRERWGPFDAPEDLLEVSGIGPRLLARMRDRIHIGEP